jgi:hypothetical protein
VANTETSKIVNYNELTIRDLEMPVRLCFKCVNKATVQLNGRDYCSIHGLEEQAKLEPKLLKEAEEKRILGKEPKSDQ